MNDQEKAIRNAVARYRGSRAISLMKSMALILVGCLLIYMSATDQFFDTRDGAEPSGALYEALGPDGVKWVATGIAVLIVVIGLIWMSGVIRDLRTGVRTFEADVRKSMENSR